MAIHFAAEELAARRAAAGEAMAARGLAGLLVFKPESMFYLTGYDTFGFCFFQCLWLGRDGAMTLLTRAPDLRQARHTSVIDDVRVWVDGPEANPAAELRDIVAGHGGGGERIGVELDTYGLTASSWRWLEAALDGFCTLEDASGLVSEHRLVKSPAELECVRRAAELGDDALAEAERLAVPGAFEGDILAAMQGVVFRGGGDYPGNEFVIGSGRGALLCRYFSGRRRLGTRDQLTLELAGAWRHYHAALMRTFVIGPVGSEQLSMHRACSDALDACLEEVRPGRAFGDVFDAHARVLDAAGLRAHRMNACGYSLGATFAPTWMDGPMFFAGNPRPIAPAMTLFVHVIVADSDAGLAMTLGETVIVTAEGCERLSHAPRNVSPGLS